MRVRMSSTRPSLDPMCIPTSLETSRARVSSASMSVRTGVVDKEHLVLLDVLLILDSTIA